MRFLAMLVSLIVLVSFSLVKAVPAAGEISTIDSVGFGGRTISAMTFNGTVGGYHIETEGTVQEIFAQVKALHPDVKLNATTAGTEDNHLVTRAKCGLLCCDQTSWGWQPASLATINDGVSYLQNHVGACGIGPNTCVRISCSYDAAIWLCNDANDSPQFNCGFLTTYVSDIIEQCHIAITSSNPQVCGQEFDNWNFNVIVRSDHC